MTGTPDNVLPVTKCRCVNFDEASTVEEHLGSHVTESDELGAVLQVTVVLLQNLSKDARIYIDLFSPILQ